MLLNWLEMKRLFIVLAVVIFAGILSGAVTVKKSTETKIYVVNLYADWCPVCKKMEVPYNEAISAFKNDEVVFITFDFSNDDTILKSEELAEELGLTKIYKDNYRKTGYALIVDKNNKQRRGKLVHTMSADEMVKKIQGNCIEE